MDLTTSWNSQQDYLCAYRSSHRTCSVKKLVLRNFAKFTRKHLCQSLFFNLFKKTLAHVFSGEFCEISKNTFSTERLQTTASVGTLQKQSPEVFYKKDVLKILQNLLEATSNS